MQASKANTIAKVVSSSGGFYNPHKGKDGEFYLKVTGIPKGIKIKYSGNIYATKNDNFHADIVILNNINKGILLIFSFSPVAYPEEKIFNFTGKIDSISYVKVSSWGGGSFFADMVNYDQIDTPMGSSETNLEDDSIKITEPSRKRKRARVQKRGTNRDINRKLYYDKINKVNNLPDNYVAYKKDKKQKNNQYCYNCSYFDKFHCKKWHNKVKARAWCKSWNKKEGVE